MTVYTFSIHKISTVHSAFLRLRAQFLNLNWLMNKAIYIWVIKSDEDKNYVHYMGETTNFTRRQREHFTQIIVLNYYIIDPVKAKMGTHDPRTTLEWNVAR